MISVWPKTWHLFLGLWMCFVLGCAGPLVRRGDAYAEMGHWMHAADAYARASEIRPNSGEIAQKHQHSRVQAVQQELARAETALDGGDLTRAWLHVGQAARVYAEDSRVGPVRTRIRLAAVEKIRTFISVLNWEKAYEVWGLLRRYDLSSAEARSMGVELAESMVDYSDYLRGVLKYWEARALLLELGRRQPAYAREVEIRVQELTERWASGMRYQAIEDFNSKDFAGAYVRSSVAAGLTGHREDFDVRIRMRQAMLKQYGVIVGTSVTGERKRASRFRGELSRALSWKSVVRWSPRNPKAELGGRIVLAPARFDETFKLRTGSQQYVSGYEEVVNPAWEQQRKAVHEMAARLHQLEMLIGELEGEISLYQAQIVELSLQLPVIKQRLERLKKNAANAMMAEKRAVERLRESEVAETAVKKWEHQRSSAEKELQEARDELDAANAELEQLGRSTPGAGVSVEGTSRVERQQQAETRLQAAEARVASAEEARETLVAPTESEKALAGQMAQRRAEAQSAHQAVARAHQKVDELRVELEEKQVRYDQALAERGATRQELNDSIEEMAQFHQAYRVALARYHRIPETVTREILDLFSFDIRDWKNTCTVVADMSGVTPRQDEMRQVLTFTSETHDSAHPAHYRYGVSADPLRYPKTTYKLTLDADVALQSGVNDWIRRALQGVRATRLDRARRNAGRDVEAAMADYLVGWMLSPRQRPADFETFLMMNYGKMDLDWLEI